MEYIEGETLAQRLMKGPLPIQQVLQYAIEIADALDKAHRKGITHRDLKPGNIMLTKSGTKLLDFGLAKLAQDAAPATPESQLATMKDAITAQGTILGTLQYMAPEQVEGKQDQIDARTDIFAFGVVVYEMATGKKAFEGKSQASLMAKILETGPGANGYARADDAAGAGPRRQALHGKRSGRALAIGKRYLRTASLDFRKRPANSPCRPLRGSTEAGQPDGLDFDCGCSCCCGDCSGVLLPSPHASGRKAGGPLYHRPAGEGSVRPGPCRTPRSRCLPMGAKWRFLLPQEIAGRNSGFAHWTLNPRKRSREQGMERIHFGRPTAAPSDFPLMES